jgi:acyl-CoA thioesterase-2
MIDLAALLDLETLDTNLFRGSTYDIGSPQVFGGQVLAQALVAGQRTLEGYLPHSLHGYFLKTGDLNHPLYYEVERLREGKSFAARRVQAIQHGEVAFTMIASFQRPEEGLEHQAKMPDVPAPDTLVDGMTLRRGWLDEVQADAELAGRPLPERVLKAVMRELPIEFRPVSAINPFKPRKRAPQQAVWFRCPQPLPDDPALHRAVLTYASDFNLVSTALLPHGVTWLQGGLQVASLDHALWLHRPCRCDDWLLYVMESPTSQGSRGLSHANIFDQQGRLVASAAQEGLMRVKLPKVVPNL